MTVATPHSNRRSAAIQNWHDANQQFLSQSLEQVRQALIENAADQTEALNHQLRAALNDDLIGEGVLGSSYDGQPFTVELIARIFELNQFELSILLLCAGMELDAQWAKLCEAVSGRVYPTFGLALNIFEKASWEVLTPSGTLRRSHLIEIDEGSTLINSPLRIDERILHYLTGVQYLDERLRVVMTAINSPGSVLTPAYQALVDRAINSWTKEDIEKDIETPLPVIQLVGEDSTSLRTLAFEACRALRLTLQSLPAETLPTDWQQLEKLSTLCDREYHLNNIAILLNCENLENETAGRKCAIASFINNTHLPLIVTNRLQHKSYITPRSIVSRTITSLELTNATPAEQH